MNPIYRIMGRRGRITIPYETRLRVGFSYNDILSFTEAPDGKSVVVKRERICDNCATNPNAADPFRTQDDGEATDGISLEDFLNSLTEEQQKAALAYLNMRWLMSQNHVSQNRN